MKIFVGLGLLLVGGCAAGATLIAGSDTADATWKSTALIISAITSGLGLVLTAYSVWQGRQSYTKDQAKKDHDALTRTVVRETNETVLQHGSTRAHVTEQNKRAEDRAERRHAELLAKLDAARPDAEQFSDALLNALADRTNPDLSLEDQVSDLIARFDAAQELIDAGERPSNLDVFVQAVQKRVANKMRAGDLDGADKEAGDAFTQWQREEAERAEAAKQGGLAILDTGIDTALARGDADMAAQREWQKIQLEHEETDRTGALWARQAHYIKEGKRTGARLDLQVSLALCEIGLKTAPTPQDRAGHHNHKAIALRVMGERAGGEEGLTYLRQAIDGYDSALTVYTRETMPADWAMTQQNKAIALRVMGERAGGEAGLTYLRQAIDAYDSALTVYTPETVPTKWAMTQQNKAGALQVMVQRAGGEEGLTYLRQAIDAYDNALTVYTRETMPADWAMTQQNKAIALKVKGQRAGGGAGLTYLRQAIKAYDNALTVRTRETMPAKWAMTRANMATLFVTLYEHDEVASHLANAEKAASDAMPIFQSGGMDWYAGEFQKTVDKIAALKARHQP